jgi:hypothetical protein
MQAAALRNLALSPVVGLLILMLLSIPLAASQDSKVSPGEITGSVTIDGRPAPNVTVIALSATGEPGDRLFQMMLRPPSARARTDQDGRYRLTNLAPGDYQVFPSSPSHTSEGASGEKSIEVGEGKVVEEINFGLVRGGVITGRVTDSNGRPIIGEMITLKRLGAPASADPNPLLMGLSQLGNRMYLTDDRGIYRIFGLSPGRYAVGVGIGGMNASLFVARQRVQPTYYAGVSDIERARAVEVGAGAEVTGIDIQMGSGDKLFAVTGRVIDAESRSPVTTGFVLFRRLGNDRTARPGEIVFDADGPGMAPVGSKGEFKLTSVASGRYEIEANALAAGLLGGGNQYYSDKLEIEVNGADLSGIEVKTHRGATISGTLVMDDSAGPAGEPLSDLIVHFAGNEAAGAKVSADGSFSVGGLRAGTFSLNVQALLGSSTYYVRRIERDGVDQGRTIEVQANQQISGLRTVIVRGDRVIRGRIVLQGGALPRGGALTLRATSVTLDETFEAVADAKGNFTIEDLPPGDYEVEALFWDSAHLGEGERKVVSTKQRVSLTSESAAEITFYLDAKSVKN